MARGKTISVDLRQRAVDAYENGEGTYQEIADRFCIGRTTLCDLVRLSRYANTLEPIKEKRPRSDRRVDEAGKARLLELVAAMPDATLAELTDAYNVEADKPVSRATMGRAVLALKLSRKKRASGQSSGTRRASSSGAGDSRRGRLG
jgi:transposase